MGSTRLGPLQVRVLHSIVLAISFAADPTVRKRHAHICDKKDQNRTLNVEVPHELMEAIYIKRLMVPIQSTFRLGRESIQSQQQQVEILA